jgi:hypothetical protein
MIRKATSLQLSTIVANDSFPNLGFALVPGYSLAKTHYQTSTRMWLWKHAPAKTVNAKSYNKKLIEIWIYQDGTVGIINIDDSETFVEVRFGGQTRSG